MPNLMRVELEREESTMVELNGIMKLNSVSLTHTLKAYEIIKFPRPPTLWHSKSKKSCPQQVSSSHSQYPAYTNVARIPPTISPHNMGDWNDTR